MMDALHWLVFTAVMIGAAMMTMFLVLAALTWAKDRRLAREARRYRGHP
jgi:multisubunit Na+/H+ antiporter MnhC subunit